LVLADRCWRSIVCSTVCRAMACVAAGGAAPAVGRQPAARLVGVPGQDRDPAAVRHTSTLYTSLSHAFPTHFPPDEQTQPTPTQLYGSHAITPVGDRALFRALTPASPSLLRPFSAPSRLQAARGADPAAGGAARAEPPRGRADGPGAHLEQAHVRLLRGAERRPRVGRQPQRGTWHA